MDRLQESLFNTIKQFTDNSVEEILSKTPKLIECEVLKKGKKDREYIGKYLDHKISIFVQDNEYCSVGDFVWALVPNGDLGKENMVIFGASHFENELGENEEEEDSNGSSIPGYLGDIELITPADIDEILGEEDI